MRPGVILTGVGLFGLSVLLSAAGGFTAYDEAWFLQVVHRVTSGEALYRDVFFGATPLSVQVTALAVRLFGAEILVVKAAVGVCFALSVLMVARIDRQLGGPRGFPVLLVLALLMLGRPLMAPYSAMSTVLLLATLSAALRWHEAVRVESRGGRGAATVALAAAGLAAGLSFASKQNIGAYAAAALVASLAVAPPGWRALGPRLAVAGGAFAPAAGLPVVPVWLDGAAERFLAYGFLNKAIYLTHAGIWHLEYFESPIQLVRLSPAVSLWDGLRVVYDLQRFALPPLTAATLLAAWLRVDHQRRATVAVVFFFVAAGFLGVFPRTDNEHLIHATPPLVVGLAYGLREAWPTGGTWKRVGAAALLVWLGIGLALALLTPAVQVARGTMRVSTLPHFRGTLVPTTTEEDFAARARALAAAAAGEQPFLLIPEAGFYYLLTGLRNPTPYDYPYVTTFGPHGQRDVIASIVQGRIRTVCFATRGPNALRPVELARYVQEQMTRGEDAGACTLYRRRG